MKIFICFTEKTFCISIIFENRHNTRFKNAKYRNMMSENAHISTHCWHVNLSNILCLIIENLRKHKATNQNLCFIRTNSTSAGEAKVKSMSAADPDAGVGALDVACVRADISLKTGLRVVIVFRIKPRTAFIAICSKK